jgi:protein MpaA
MKTLQYPIHDVDWVHRRVRELGAAAGLRFEVLHGAESDAVVSLHSPAEEAGKRVYLSAGLHGDEPAGVLALLLWLEDFGRWRGKFAFDIFPCLNPWGLRRNLRTDSTGVDLNRAYGGNGSHALIAAHETFIAAQAGYDLALLLHEDYDAWGAYVYEVTAEPDLWSPHLLAAASPHCPVDPRLLIDESEATQGVIAVDLTGELDTREFEAAHLFHSGSRRVLTVETPSELDLFQRAQAHLAMIESGLLRLAEDAPRQRLSPPGLG